MSQAYQPQVEMTYTPPNVRQFSVFLDNRVGQLFQLVRLFDEAPDIHLCALSVQESAEYGVIRIIANNADATRKLLREQGHSFSELDLLIVELCNGHSLSSLCLSLLGAELNIRFAYPLLLAHNGTPTIALAVDDNFLGGQLLRRKNFRLLGEGDLV